MLSRETVESTIVHSIYKGKEMRVDPDRLKEFLSVVIGCLPHEQPVDDFMFAAREAARRWGWQED